MSRQQARGLGRLVRLGARGLAIVVAAALAPLSLPAAPSVAEETGSDQTIIVTLDPGLADTEQAAQEAVEATGATVTDSRPISERSVAVTVADVSEAKAEAIGDAAADQTGVTAAQPSRRVHSATDDTHFTKLWNLNDLPGSTYGVHAENAWPTSNGSHVVVGVIDTGMTKHSDLSSATSIVGGNVIAGYDFITDAANAGDGDGADAVPADEGGGSNWHGTHVAGTIAALGNNRKGVIGVAPVASVQPLRVLGRDGGTEADIITAITWGAGLKVPGMAVNPRPAAVLNLSLSSDPDDPDDPSTYACDEATQTAIDAAVSNGTAIVVAAGNGYGDDLRYYYPGNCQNVIRVVATDKDGTLADYSNHGSSAFPATVAAPGTGILSTWYDPATKSESYTSMDGTSMAAPHVSGVIALLKAARPTLSVAQIVDILTSTANPVSNCSTTACGAGIVDATRAVAAVGNSRPVSVAMTRPKISGTAKVRSKLTASVGSWVPTSAKVSWRWLRNGKAITGATSRTYTAVAADKDQLVSVRATVRYFDATKSRTSSAVTVAGLKFTSQAKPKISGSFRVGHRLTVKVGTVKPTATGKRYQWLRNGKPIAKATSSAYRLTRADRHKKISVKVTVRRAGYIDRSATSSAHKVK
jgi:serine protease